MPSIGLKDVLVIPRSESDKEVFSSYMKLTQYSYYFVFVCHCSVILTRNFKLGTIFQFNVKITG